MHTGGNPNTYTQLLNTFASLVRYIFSSKVKDNTLPVFKNPELTNNGW